MQRPLRLRDGSNVRYDAVTINPPKVWSVLELWFAEEIAGAAPDAVQGGPNTLCGFAGFRSSTRIEGNDYVAKISYYKQQGD
jgi:hypothetical protein